MKYLLCFSLLLNFWFTAPIVHAQTLDAGIEAKMDDILKGYFPAEGPGGVVLIAQKDKILYQKAFGMAHMELGVPLRTDHVFRIGSVTKQFTGAAILQLVEAGQLALQDEITKFIPDYPTHGKKITVEHLLTHTSGIKSYTGMIKWTPQEHRRDMSPVELIDFFKDEPMDFDPNEQYKYNNSAYILLGYIIEKVSGLPYGKYVEERIFKPLNMRHSYYGDNEPIIKNRAAGYSQNDDTGIYNNAAFLSMTQPYAAGSLLSTVEDLYIWTRALHGGGVIKQSSLDAAITPHRLNNGTSTRYGYGLGMGNLWGSPTIEHTGGIHGFLSDLIYVPQSEICIAILTNCDCKSPDEVATQLAALLMGQAYQPQAISVQTSILNEYIGVYENEEKEQRYLTVEDGQLYSQRKGSTKFKLQAYGPDQFFFPDAPVRLHFVREEGKDKKVAALELSDRKVNQQRWKKTSLPLPAERSVFTVTAEQLTPLIGEYEILPGFRIAITQQGSQLYCQATGQSRFELYPASANRFFLKVVDAELEFYPNEKGVVDRMVLFQGGGQQTGKRVK
jgi:CubicO group peptidase (beta-lactamase class C family)